MRKTSVVLSNNWPSVKVDYELDSEAFMEEVKAKEEEEFKGKKNKIPVDSTGNFSVAYEVFYD